MFIKKSKQIPAQFYSQDQKSPKLILVFIQISITIILIGIFVISKQHLTKINLHTQQLSSLINEVGALKQGNLEENARHKITSLNLKALQTNIDLINQNLNLLDQTKQNLVKTTSELQLAQEELENIKKNNQKVISKVNILKANDPYQEEGLYSDNILDILILGTHASLTDTIITASINQKLNTVSLISIPRDLFVNGRKINEIYQKFGIEKLSEIIYEISGILVEKYVIIDMETFTQIIDLLGGVEINVDKTLIDHLYPGPNRTYTTFAISSGLKTLDGATALKYVRSRETTSDFDRSLRQQALIEAITNKLKNLPVKDNMQSLYDLYRTLSASVLTNLNPFRAIEYYKIYQNFKIERSNVISTGNFLYSTHTEGGQYILLPKNGNFDQIKEYIQKIIRE